MTTEGPELYRVGEKYRMDPQAAKRYMESPQKPEYTLNEPKPTKGGHSIVKAYISSREMDLNKKAAVRFETKPGKQEQMEWGFFRIT